MSLKNALKEENMEKEDRVTKLVELKAEEVEEKLIIPKWEFFTVTIVYLNRLMLFGAYLAKIQGGP